MKTLIINLRKLTNRYLRNFFSVKIILATQKYIHEILVVRGAIGILLNLTFVYDN